MPGRPPTFAASLRLVVLLRLAAAALLAGATLLVMPAAAGAAPGGPPSGERAPTAAQEPDAPADDDAPTTTADRVPTRDIIPDPNSGRPPSEAGDRGGALQALVFVLILAGLGAIAAVAARDVRRHRAAAGDGQPSEPKSSSQAG
ncbi:MAG TPA: hypothetical protein VFZ77_07715 [Acidimicrobiales bacterium]